MNKQELAEQILRKHLGNKFTINEFEKKIIAALVEAMQLQAKADTKEANEAEDELVEDILSEFRRIGIDTSEWEEKFGDGNFAHEFIAAGIQDHLDKITEAVPVVEAMGVQKEKVEWDELRAMFTKLATASHVIGYLEQNGYTLTKQAPAKAVEVMPENPKEKPLPPDDNALCFLVGANVYHKRQAAIEAKSKKTEQPVEVMDSLPAKKGNDYVASNSNTDDTSLASHPCTDGGSIEQCLVSIYRELKSELKQLSEKDYEVLRLVGYQDCIFDFMITSQQTFGVDVKKPNTEQNVQVSDTTTDAHSGIADNQNPLPTEGKGE